MERISQWVVAQGDAPAHDGEYGPVMAWARDRVTGEPIYIQELDSSRKGAKCDCECPSCNLPLTAVNAGKKEYFRRPHFRHPVGAEKSECLYLSARLAALQLLRDQGFIQLPLRKRSSSFIGISGFAHEAWAEHPPERVPIKSFDFRDKAAAILTLADGRQLRVLLTGTGPAASSDGLSLPTIYLDMEEPSLAGMSLVELRSRITLIPDGLCWYSHWRDTELQEEAELKAKASADNLMDLGDLYVNQLEGIEPNFRYETILHLEVKRILGEVCSIHVPSVEVSVWGYTADGDEVKGHWGRPACMVPLLAVELERRFGGVIPDVIALTPEEHGGTLLIEVTVTNKIDDVRLDRIRKLNIPALEIDLSITGGLISRADLRDFVVYSLVVKKWLHHPEYLRQHLRLEQEIAAEIATRKRAAEDAREKKEAALAKPIDEIVQNYLSAVLEYADLCAQESAPVEEHELMKFAAAQIALHAEAFALHGYPEALDTRLAGQQHAIVPRLLSIKLGRGVGYRLDSTMKVLNAIKQSSERSRADHTLYLIAEKTFRPSYVDVSPPWYSNWVNEIKASIASGRYLYVRDGKFDRLLALLFPEMKAGLENGYGRILNDANRRQVTHQMSAENRREVQKVKEFYTNGAYRQYALAIDFDKVLSDAIAIKNGDSYFKWYEIWSDRYQLRYDLLPIARLLSAAGFRESIDQWNEFNRYVQEVKSYKDAPVNHHLIQPIAEPSIGLQPVNLYAELKGRTKSRRTDD